MTSAPTRVAFLRPRLGIGGSERLVTDAAVALSQRGYNVTMFVPDRLDVAQFPGLAEHGIETKRAGAFLPNDIAGRLRAPLAIARTAWAAWKLSRHPKQPSLILCDVVPHVIPWLKRRIPAPVLYYCHYPDLLLTRAEDRHSPVYQAYREPIDRSEERGLRSADVVVTNSRYTAEIVRHTFPQLSGAQMRVLYPGVACPAQCPEPPTAVADGEIVLLSVNRFDPRKNLLLAVDALDALRRRLNPALFSRVRLVMAGYYDQRLAEVVQVVEGLRRRAAELNLLDRLDLRFSPTDDERTALLADARCVVYTPEAEHFGYVPIEAMAAGRAVIAVGHGGPAETVVHGSTGLLCEPTADAFAAAMAIMVESVDTAAHMGRAGYAHVSSHFSIERFGDTLEEVVSGLIASHKKRRGQRE